MDLSFNSGTIPEVVRDVGIGRELEFTDLFDIEEIQKIQDSFSKATGVASIITHTDGTPITRPSNFCRLCIDIIRNTEKGLSNCIYSDSIIGRNNPEGPITSKCYSGGLLDGGASITVQGKHIANWLIGQVIDADEFDESQMLKYADTIGADKTTYKIALSEVKRMPKEKFESISNFLFIIANQMSELAAKSLQMSESVRLMSEETKKRMEAEQLYFKLINVSPDGISLADEDMNIIFASAKILEMLGIKDGNNILGTKLSDWVAEEDLQTARENINQRIIGKFIPSISYRLKRADGSKFYAEINSSPLYGDTGNPKGIMSVVRDITERIEYQKKLEESEKNLAEILRKSPLPIILVNNEGKTEFINDQFEMTFGYSFDEVNSISELQKYISVDNIFREWPIIRLNNHADDANLYQFQQETDIIIKNGMVKTVQIKLTIIKNKRIIILNDITDSKNAQKKILENNALLTSIIESPSDIVIYSLDRNLNYSSFNSNYKMEVKALYAKDLQLGMNISDAVCNEDELSRLKMNLQRVLVNGEQYKLYEDYGKGVNKKYFESAYNPIFDAKGIIEGVTVFINNITERVKVKSALRASEEKFRLAVNQVPGVIWTVDKNLVFTMSVGAGLIKLNLKPGQAIGMTLFEFYNNNDKNFKPIAMHYKALEGKSVNFKMQFAAINYEISLEPLRNEKGSIIGILGIALDVSERIKAENERKMSELRYSQMIGNIPVGVIIHSPDSEIQTANNAACEILGIFPDESEKFEIAEKYWKMYDEKHELLERENHPFNLAMKTGLPVNNMTVGFSNGNGNNFRWVLLNAFPIYSFDNTPEQVIVVLIDITDKKKAEERLEKQRLQLYSIMEGMDEPVYVQDPDTFNILYSNDAFRKVYGASENRKCHDVIYNSETPCDFCSNNIIFKDKSNENYIWEMYNNRNNRWYRCIDRVIEWSDGKKVRFEIAIDITDIKKARQELEETRALFAAALEQVPAGIIIADSAGSKIRIMNKVAGDLLHTEITEILGRNIWDGLPWQTLTKEYEIIEYKGLPLAMALMGIESAGNEELVIKRRDGTDIWVLSNAAPVYNNNGELIAGITIFNDISDKVAEIKIKEDLIGSLEAKNIEMERFIYTVSHDLKSPLVTIKGFSGMIEQDLLEGNIVRASKDLGRIAGAADKMQELLEGLLKISRVGRIEANYTSVNINEVVNEVTALLDLKIKELHAAVITESSLPLVIGDKLRIFEIFLNLIDNALKFSIPGNNPIIEIGCDRSKTEKYFYVRDNGIGIDPKYWDKVFKIFEKLDIHTSGSGVGLALVKRIIEVQGGIISIESEGAGKGTTFLFTLPGSSN